MSHVAGTQTFIFYWYEEQKERAWVVYLSGTSICIKWELKLLQSLFFVLVCIKNILLLLHRRARSCSVWLKFSSLALVVACGQLIGVFMVYIFYHANFGIVKRKILKYESRNHKF